jgi:hypothetical protein
MEFDLFRLIEDTMKSLRFSAKQKKPTARLSSRRGRPRASARGGSPPDRGTGSKPRPDLRSPGPSGPG